LKKLLVLYKSKMAIGEVSVSDMLANATHEQMEAGMAAWAASHKKCDGMIADLGAPLDNSNDLEEREANSAPTDLISYSILQAPSMEGGASLLKDRPHFYTPGSSIQIIECVPTQGM